MTWNKANVAKLAVIAGVAIVLVALLYPQPRAAVKSPAIARLKRALEEECVQLSLKELSKLDRPALEQFVKSHVLKATFGSFSGVRTTAHFAILPLAFLGIPEEPPYIAVLVPCEKNGRDVVDLLNAPSNLKTLDEEIRQRYAHLGIAPIAYQHGAGAKSLTPEMKLITAFESHE